VRFLEERVTQLPLPAGAHGLYLALVKTLATRTAQLHAVLAGATSEPGLAPEPISSSDLAAWRRSARSAATAALKMLAERARELPPAMADDAERLLARRATLLRSIGAATGRAARGLKIRCHGDYHLRQVLLKRNDFVITDFESSPDARALQRRKSSSLTDVASMLRSFAYARRTALQQCSLIAADERSRWDGQLDDWEQQTRHAFLSTYDEIARARGLYASFAGAATLLRLFELEAACADLRQELLSRPDWAAVPLRRVLAALSA